MTVAAIILAAGQGTRFGAEPKLLASLRGKPLVRHVTEAACSSRATPVIVVTGHRRTEVEAALAELPVQIVRNLHFAEGLSASVKAGFAALPSRAEAAVVLLGDMPRVSATLLDTLIGAWLENDRPSAVVPIFDGQRGNPVLLSRALRDDVARLSGDVGAGPMLRTRPDVLELPVSDPAVLYDVDKPADLVAPDR